MANDKNLKQSTEELPQPIGTDGVKAKRFEEEFMKQYLIAKEQLDKNEETLKILFNKVDAMIKNTNKVLEESAKAREKADQLIQRCEKISNSIKIHKIPEKEVESKRENTLVDEIKELKIENKEKSETVKELKQELIQKEEEIVTLKEENATLKNQIIYLWELIKTYLATQFTALAKNFHAFFSKSKESESTPINEKENTQRCDI